jgi:phage/plasmid-associated DNA primase
MLINVNMGDENKGYIYCLRKKEFIEDGKNIYKIGRTKRMMYERLEEYPKGSKILAHNYCKNVIEAESELKKEFIKSKKITQKLEYGIEYFEGEIVEIITTMNDVLRKYYVDVDNDVNEIYDTVTLVHNFIDILVGEYFNEYDKWTKVAMILKYTGSKINYDFYDTLVDFSKKSIDYNEDSVNKYWNKLDSKKITITIGSLFEFAKKSNSSEYRRILQKINLFKNIEISEKFICEKIKEIAGPCFFYNDERLYSFDLKNNLWYVDSTETLKKFISDDLYDYIFALLNDCIDSGSYLDYQVKNLKKHCLKNKYLEELVKTFRTRFLNDNVEINFDSNPFLLGFNNGVYDLKKKIFRNYLFDDYITTRTGYNYTPSKEVDRKYVNNLYEKIETDEKNRDLLWKILASGAIGVCYQKFVIFSGNGGNGKSLTTKFMLEVLGNYAYKGNINTLCSKQKTGANPEMANMHMKRYVVFSEPESTDKILNSILKDLSGGTKINARKLYENNCNLSILATFVVECNDIIMLKNDSTDGEIRRIISYCFGSKFTFDENEVNESQRIFLATQMDEGFVLKYRDAFLDILIEKAYSFINDDEQQFKITESIKIDTERYISSSYQFLNFLNDVAEYSGDKKCYLKISDIHNKFKYSDFYINSNSSEKREKLTVGKMKEFFKKNKETSLRYKDMIDMKINDVRHCANSVLIGYSFKCEW